MKIMKINNNKIYNSNKYLLKSYVFSDIIPLFFLKVLSLFVFLIPIQNLDELWNYNFARCIANGLIPYKDFSILQTPLSAYISAFFVHIFGGGLFAFRICAYVLLSLTQIVFYFLSLQTTKSKLLSFTLTIFIFALSMLGFYYNYNNLSLIIVLIILMLKLSNKSTLKKHLLEGLLFGLLPLIKQSTGLALFMVYLLECLYRLFVKKVEIKRYIIVLGIGLLPSILFLGLLALSGNFKSFYEYAVLGVTTFNHKIDFIKFMLSDPLSFVFALCAISAVFYIVFAALKGKFLVCKKTVCFVIALVWLLSVTYPIFDLSHFIVGVIPLIAVFFLFVKYKPLSKKDTVVLKTTACFIIIIACVANLPYGNDYKFSNLKNYQNIAINKRIENNIKTIDRYILEANKNGNTVLIADATASIYTIPLNTYTKNWDMLLIGNVGKNTPEDLLNNADGDFILVLRNENNLNWQSHFELIDYIKENYKKIDEVLYFDVYKK